MPPKRPGHHDHPGGRPHGWLYNHERKDVPVDQALELMSKIVSSLHEHSRVRLTDQVVVALPGQIDLVVRHEQGPRGDYVLKLELRWDAKSTGYEEIDPAPILGDG